MTREQRDNWARVCAELTDDLPSKINSIGRALVKHMTRANQKNPFSDCEVGGMELTLILLGVPYQVHKDGDIYRAVEIAGEMFYVEDSPDADEASGDKNAESMRNTTFPIYRSSDFKCPYFDAESGFCALDDPAHECDDYQYCTGYCEEE